MASKREHIKAGLVAVLLLLGLMLAGFTAAAALSKPVKVDIPIFAMPQHNQPAVGQPYAPLVVVPDHTAELLAQKQAQANAERRQVLAVYERADYDAMRGVVYEPEGE